MKNLKLKMLVLALGLNFMGWSQITTNINQSKPYIQITGVAEKMIVPDEIYISITLVDEPKKKYDLDKQEEDLKSEIMALGIDLKHLTLSHAYAGYVGRKRKKGEVRNSISYTLKVNTANQVSKVFEKLDKIGIEGAFISRVDHSKILEFKKEVRIEAIKAAKLKATYLLEAIDEKLGKPLAIDENQYSSNLGWGYFGKSVVGNSISNDDSLSEYAKIGNVQFKKIKVKSEISIKFEIQ